MARTLRHPRRSYLLRGAGVGVIGLAIAACSPITTLDPYSASDGVRAVLGEQVRATNLLILTNGEGEEGVLVGGLVNETDEPTEVTVTVGSETNGLRLGPRETLLFSSRESVLGLNARAVEPLTISSVSVPPGAVTDVELSTPSAGSVTVQVPVLDGTLEPYDTLVPGGAPPSEPSPAEEEPSSHEPGATAETGGH